MYYRKLVVHTFQWGGGNRVQGCTSYLYQRYSPLYILSKVLHQKDKGMMFSELPYETSQSCRKYKIQLSSQAYTIMHLVFQHCLLRRLDGQHISSGQCFMTAISGICPQWPMMVGCDQHLVLTDHNLHLYSDWQWIVYRQQVKYDY